MRIAALLQTPRDEHSSVLLTYQALGVELAARGHSLVIVTPTDFPSLGRWSGRWTPILYPLAIARWLRRHRGEVDAAVFHSYAGWWAAAAGVTRGLAHVVAFHGLEPLYHGELLEEPPGARGLSWRYRLLQERFMPMALGIACRHATRVVCLNRTERDEIVRRRWAQADRVDVVAHGVPDAFLSVERAARPVRSLLFVGQWLPMKGIAHLVTAFNELARRHPDMHLVCAGTLVHADVVRASFDPDVQGRVTVLPRVHREALLECHAEADIFVFPSLYEGFGLALLEAMASGLPIITTAVGVAADALRDREDAVLVPKRDPAVLVGAVERLIADQALRERLGAAARRRALEYCERDRLWELADILIGLARASSPGAGRPRVTREDQNPQN